MLEHFTHNAALTDTCRRLLERYTPAELQAFGWNVSEMRAIVARSHPARLYSIGSQTQVHAGTRR